MKIRYVYNWSTAHTSPCAGIDARECDTLRAAIAAAKDDASSEIMAYNDHAYVTVRAVTDGIDCVIDAPLVFAAYSRDGDRWTRYDGDFRCEPIYSVSEARKILRDTPSIRDAHARN